jgi:hypothetical protein
MDLPTMRARVRRDLRDEDSANYRWTDNEVDRHIERAVRELSLAAPLEATANLVTSAGNRDLDVASLTNRVSIDAVEYPTALYPTSYAAHSLWANRLTLLIEGAPAAGEAVVVRYSKLHTLDATSSTLPEALEDVVATGAAAYAALEWASYATNRVNVGGADAWSHFHTWGAERMVAFHKALAKYGRARRLRSSRLYLPADGVLGVRPLGE